MASTLTGLNLRGTRWYINIVIPPDLRQVYGKRAMNLALETSDRREATARGTMKRAEWLAEFAAKRRELKPEPLAVITPELAQELALRVRARVLRQDESLRDDPATLAPFTDAIKAIEHRGRTSLSIGGPTPYRPPVRDVGLGAGLHDDDAETLAGLNALLNARAGADLAKRRRAAVLPLVRFEALKLGLSFDPHAEGAQEALGACLMAYRKARQEAALRDVGEAIETPAVPHTSQPFTTFAKAKARTLRDVYDKWKVSGDKARSTDSLAVYDRALKQFEGQHKGLALADITREIGDTYRTWLRENCNTTKTARDRLTNIKSLLKFAHETLEWIPKQPWRGLDIKTTTTNKRRPWTNAELTTLFSAPLHTVYALPDARYAGREAAYWIPLLGLFTGTRLGELCQLRTVDVQKVEGIDVLVLTNEGEGQSIKSDAGHRSVPIHSELVRLGFLKYVKTIKEAGSDSLWPSLPLREGKPSDFFGRWFGAHCKAMGLAPTFHYLRHTVRPLMRKAGVNEGTMDKVTGHKTVGSIGTVVYDHRTLSEVQEAVEAIRYPALTLPVVGLLDSADL
ncbi:site-specific integrase [Variovorax sp. RO1]|uniref:site-specific integrase n=1 Tax=Variovorax sp. RO1 TaxID=2066034 RepID=UPI0015DD5A9C|nr:site-specific integrase [Variovorax sp. RO1]